MQPLYSFGLSYDDVIANPVAGKAIALLLAAMFLNSMVMPLHSFMGSVSMIRVVAYFQGMLCVTLKQQDLPIVAMVALQFAIVQFLAYGILRHTPLEETII